MADDFTRNQIEGRLRTRLEDALGAAFGRQVRIAVTVDPELAPTAHRDGRPDSAARTRRRLSPTQLDDVDDRPTTDLRLVDKSHSTSRPEPRLRRHRAAA